jgi:hypothetical protein
VKAIRQLSDVIVMDRPGDATESEGEDFNMDVEASDSHGEESAEAVDPKL